MTYDFSFEKKSVAAILACATLLFALLFFAGVMVGVGWHAKDDSRADAASMPDATREPAARTAFGVAPAPASRSVSTQAPPPATAYAIPQEPVLYEDPARREYAAEGYGQRPYDAQPYGGAQGYGDARDYAAQTAARPRTEPDGYAAGGYAPQRYAARGADAQASTSEAAPAQPPATTGRSEAARLSARGIDPDPRLVQEAGASVEESGAGARASSSYTVQVGAYLQEGEAQRIARELENKGYTPKVISGLDAEARTWYAVRIGSYGSAREAGTAASNFSKQEGLKVAVRPAGSL
ncbi:MAG TPA: SPOR domain-containing protein [Pyrinomonadaceae bacterium]|jgi:cell division protein FtsN|nr:SPOR domain-containing protein [Pyrinomonadaceae bacterium]